MNRCYRKAYTRPSTPAGEITRSLFELIGVIVLIPIKLTLAIICGLLGGGGIAIKNSRPRRRQFD